MCGIAGLIDVSGERRPVDPAVLRRMTAAIQHRGPDDHGIHIEPGVGLAACRLSIIDLAGGHQPIANEDRSVWVVFNGELFEYPELQRELAGRGHRLATRCDTELVVHLWEEDHEQLFRRLKGQFAFALWDRASRTALLARDRVGICPLYWARRHGWLIYGSEIKAILASGLVDPQPDVQGIDHIFTFLCAPSPRTCFEGVNYLAPGSFLRVRDGRIEPGRYWDLDFPDWGAERTAGSDGPLVDRFEELLQQSIARRLRADVPVVGYLSGGVDSAVVLALAGRERGGAVPAFTIQVGRPRFDEMANARATARALGARQVITRCAPERIARQYPALIRAAEAPVLDTSCGCLLLQAQAVHAHGYKVALTGEGADEALAGYAWFKIERGVQWARGLGVSTTGFSSLGHRTARWMPDRAQVERVRAAFGCYPAQQYLYNLSGQSRSLFYTPAMWQRLGGLSAYDDLQFDARRIQRWHPLNRSLYVGYRMMLARHLLFAKGDRIAMNASVETRYPFLDEDVIEFAAGIDPKFKLNRLRDKYLLRRVAGRLLPGSVARRPKGMFRAPLWRGFEGPGGPAFVEELLSTESLARAGYFDAAMIARARAEYARRSWFSPRRLILEVGLVGALSTQLWHHLFIDPALCSLPAWSPPARWVARGEGRVAGEESAVRS